MFGSQYTKFWPLTSVHIHSPDCSVARVTCQRPFSSVSLAVVCVICECGAQGFMGDCVVMWSASTRHKGQCSGNRDGKTRVQQSHLELVPEIHASKLSSSLFLSLWCHRSGSSGHRCLLLKTWKSSWRILRCVYSVLPIWHWRFYC